MKVYLEIMSKRLKPDAQQITDYMSGLASSLRLEGSIALWPNWIYRSDHVENTAAILNSGKLLSREAAERDQKIVKDAGSRGHISQLIPKHRNYVRLYFRPRTPTQYSNEGIRPTSKIKYGAHMPIPVYLLFSNHLLREHGVKFCRGRLAFGTSVGESCSFLQSINFGDVYHDRSVGRLGESSRQSHILNARHSEVLIEDELDLGHLKHIVCRSAPERDTLLHLLKPNIRDLWMSRMRIDEGRRRLFFKMGTFIQEVEFSKSSTRFSFYTNNAPDMRGPFDLRIEWEVDDKVLTHTNPNFVAGTQPTLFNLGENYDDYTVRVTLNEDLAYVHEYNSDLASEMVF